MRIPAMTFQRAARLVGVASDAVGIAQMMVFGRTRDKICRWACLRVRKRHCDFVRQEGQRQRE
jgi:hypothetical protein